MIFRKVHCGGVAKTEFQMPFPSLCCGLYQAAGRSLSEGGEGGGEVAGMCVGGWYIEMIMWSTRAIKAGVMQFGLTAMSAHRYSLLHFIPKCPLYLFFFLPFFLSGALRLTVPLLVGIRRRGAAEASLSGTLSTFPKALKPKQQSRDLNAN